MPPTRIEGADGDKAERELENDVVALLREYDGTTFSIRRSRAALQQLRTQLSEPLYRYKTLLGGTGRGGKWAKFLKQQNIALSTADRYVRAYEDAQASKRGKLLSEELSVPTDEQVATLVKKVQPRLSRELTTAASVQLFLARLAEALQPSDTAA